MSELTRGWGLAENDRPCPEWCDHDGPCAEARAAIAQAERDAEAAIERYYENGGAAWAQIAAEDDEEREREARDPFLMWLRAGRE